MNIELKSILQEVIIASKQAGEFIRQESKDFDPSKIEYKGKNDMVSYVDKEAEKMLVTSLRKIYPDASFITEEKTVANYEEKEYTWVIDPLDGTTNFLHGLPIYSVSVALMKGNKSILGVVYEINRDECFSAYSGGGAYMNDKKISVSNAQLLGEALVVTGFPYDLANQIEPYFEILKEMVKSSHGLRRLGSAAVDLCYVACGRLDAYYEFNINLWDVAGGAVILEEAGGIVTNFYGNQDLSNHRHIIAASKAIHPQIYQLITKYWA